MPAPLADITILAVEQFGAGPFATQQLVELGARVVKIEDPAVGGDVARYVPPGQRGEDSPYFESFNGGKESVSLDLKTEAGYEAFLALVAGADAVFSNLRGDQPARLRIRYDDLRAANPRIVCCALTGYGLTGPRAATGAYDPVIQALAGWMTLTGEPGAPPAKTGLSLVDFAAGYVSAIALLAGIHRARRDGEGCDCDLSLHETALSLLTYMATWSATLGVEPVRRASSAHQTLVPFQNFATADGHIAIACAKQRLWERLARAIDRDDLLADPRYANFAGRDRHRDALVAELEATFRSRGTADWIARIGPTGVPCAPINDVAAALRDPQAEARGCLVAYEHPVLGTVRRVRSPLNVADAPLPARPGPARGADTDAVLRELGGLDGAGIAALRARGAFGAEAAP
jgi:crotonobetainyl-CoA:carnitine CoA-transferase CaiB-like acyl-CoA transferase